MSFDQLVILNEPVLGRIDALHNLVTKQSLPEFAISKQQMYTYWPAFNGFDTL